MAPVSFLFHDLISADRERCKAKGSGSDLDKLTLNKSLLETKKQNKQSLHCSACVFHRNQGGSSNLGILFDVFLFIKNASETL